MDPRLQLAIENDDVDELHRLIVEERNLLDRASKGPFPNTPLHVASAAGKTQVAMELAILKPSFTRKLNPEGYSPMHLALEHEHYNTVRALMTLDPKLIRVRGRRGITPLHYVAGKEGDDEMELLAEFLSTCRLSIEDLTSQCETAIHIAVKNHNIKSFKVLFGWLKRVRQTRILDWKDQDGNTVLHIAASERQPEIIKLLIGYTNVKAKNFHGMTAPEIFEVNPSGCQDLAKRLCRQGCRARRFTPTLSLSQFFSRELTAFEKCANFFRIQDESARNIVLVVSTLIAAATYQAALTPQESQPYYTPIYILRDRIIEYTTCNSIAFFVSIGTIWATTFTVEANPLFYIPIPILCYAFFFNFVTQIPTNMVAIYSRGPLLALFMVAVFALPMKMRATPIGVRQRIDTTRRCFAAFEDRWIERTTRVSFFFTLIVALASIFYL